MFCRAIASVTLPSNSCFFSLTDSRRISLVSALAVRFSVCLVKLFSTMIRSTSDTNFSLSAFVSAR